ncbi:MAG: helix-turn-helix domain-containing protein [Desulfobacteraceae bacterium]|jgi:AcrR family transcriptional regulator
MNRGERITNKTKSAIKNALLELIREKNYPDITVSEITQRGNIGRSTLYKHYQSKADVLVDIHKDMFEHLFSGLSTSESWFAPDPPSELISFFERSRQLGINPFLLSYKLGSDLDYLISNINFQLTATIEKRLYNSFSDGDSSISLPILALSISNLYRGLIISWFTNYQSSNVRQFATNIQRMTRALVVEATGENAA